MEDVRELELTEGKMEAALDFTTTCKSIVDQDMIASDWSVVLFQYFISWVCGSALFSNIQTASELTNRQAVLNRMKPRTKMKAKWVTSSHPRTYYTLKHWHADALLVPMSRRSNKEERPLKKGAFEISLTTISGGVTRGQQINIRLFMLRLKKWTETSRIMMADTAQQRAAWCNAFREESRKKRRSSACAINWRVLMRWVFLETRWASWTGKLHPWLGEKYKLAYNNQNKPPS